MCASRKFFLIPIIVAIFSGGVCSGTAFSYASADIPIGHWSYEALEKLAIGGVIGVWGLDTRPMSRVQMAYKIKEGMDNIEEENLPYYLALDREYIDYLQNIVYNLINEFRQELVLVGATAAQLKGPEDTSTLTKYAKFNPGWPVNAENRYVNIKSRKDILLENENGLRLSEGYNLRTRAYPWLTAGDMFTVSATPEFRLTESHSQLFFEELSGKFSLFNLELSGGRGGMWWGPGYHGSMLLSNNAEPFNRVELRTVNNFSFPGVFKKLGLFGANFFMGKLEKDRTVPKPTIMGLRLEWSPIRYLTIGATRTDIAGGKGRPKLRLKDYWKIFVGGGKDEFSTGADIKRTDTDQLASFDMKIAIPFHPSLKAASGLELYGEWAGEDRFSFWENESPGFLAGFLLADLFKDEGTDFRFEYARNKPAWYGHGIYNASGSGTAYTYKGAIMGHHMGPDADDLFFRVSKELTFLTTPYFNSVKMGGQLDLERHGLSAAVEERLIEVVGDITWRHFDAVMFALRYEFEDYRNFNHISGNKSRNHIFLAEVDLKF